MEQDKCLHGVILKKTEYKDKDLIVDFFTRERGRMSVYFRGVKKVHSKFIAFLQMGAVLKVEVIGKNKSMPLVKGVKSIFLPEIQQYSDLLLFEDSLKIIKKICKQDHCLPKVFELLSSFVPHFCFSDKKDLLFIAYEIKLLTKLGFIGSFKVCSVCHEKIAKSSHFLNPEHGVVCVKCNKVESNFRKITVDEIKVFSFLQESSFEAIEKLRLSLNLFEEIKNKWNCFSASFLV